MKRLLQPKVLILLAMLIGLGSLFSRNPLNYAGMSFISWFILFHSGQGVRVKKDERFLSNVGKAGYLGFYLANMGFTFLFLAMGFFHLSATTVLYLMAGVFFLMNLGFLIAFIRYEEC